jgi:hypothetical protein
MVALIYPLLVLAIAGAVAMLGIHIASLFGIDGPFDHFLKFLVPALFAIFLPTIFVINRLTRDFKQKDIWRAALRGCPAWMRRTFYIILGYTWIGFFGLPLIYGGGVQSPANSARSISGVLLAFYLIPGAVLYSATRIPRIDASRRCLNGHSMPPLAKFCPECGTHLNPHTKHASAIIDES